jgi:hypothetical protein
MIRPMPIEPPPCRWALPVAADAVSEVAGIGADLEPGTLLAAYRQGIFPWPDPEGRLLWWSPDPRAVLPLDGFHHDSRTCSHLGQIREAAVILPHHIGSGHPTVRERTDHCLRREEIKHRLCLLGRDLLSAKRPG